MGGDDYLRLMFALFAAKRRSVRGFSAGVAFRESPETVVADAVDHGKGWVRNHRFCGMEDFAGGEMLRREGGPPQILGEHDADGRRVV